MRILNNLQRVYKLGVYVIKVRRCLCWFVLKWNSALNMYLTSLGG